jgi:hypothetical protein
MTNQLYASKSKKSHSEEKKSIRFNLKCNLKLFYITWLHNNFPKSRYQIKRNYDFMKRLKDKNQRRKLS